MSFPFIGGRRLLLFVGGLLAAALPSPLQAKGPAYTDPAEVDADFAYQGEYEGEIPTDGGGKGLFGVQVIALGKGKFQAVGYHGGLPGKGWNGEEPVRQDGERTGDTVLFRSDKGEGRLSAGVLRVYHQDQQLGEMKKVIRQSPTLGMKPPANATVLFDGTGVDHWKGGKMTEDGLLMQGTTSTKAFGSCTIHIEFRLPYQPEDRGQGRGNSGIYVQGRYEVQMLDSFGLAGKQNECGGLYSVKDPDLNMCLPPLTWQTYDIDYTQPRYDDAGKLLSHPRITVRHNGVVIHKDVELPGDRSTTAAPVKPGASRGPVYLQNHGNPVRYRNIWVVEK